jgi:hypothetical protein
MNISLATALYRETTQGLAGSIRNTRVLPGAFCVVKRNMDGNRRTGFT